MAKGTSYIPYSKKDFSEITAKIQKEDDFELSVYDDIRDLLLPERGLDNRVLYEIATTRPIFCTTMNEDGTKRDDYKVVLCKFSKTSSYKFILQGVSTGEQVDVSRRELVCRAIESNQDIAEKYGAKSPREKDRQKNKSKKETKTGTPSVSKPKKSSIALSCSSAISREAAEESIKWFHDLLDKSMAMVQNLPKKKRQAAIADILDRGQEFTLEVLKN